MKMKNEYLWTCDYCGEKFRTKKKSDRHELKCPKNPKNNEFVIRLKKPSVSQISIFLLILLSGYILVFGIADSYAKSNRLTRKDFFKPLSWFSDDNGASKPKPTAIPAQTWPSLSLILTPTSIPKANKSNSQSTGTSNTNTNTVECIGPDGKHFNTSIAECEKLNKAWNSPLNYMLNCKLSDNCGGGTKRVSKLECDAGVCCQIGSSWTFYTSKDKCTTDQNNHAHSSNSGNGNYNPPPSNTTSNQNTSPKVAFQATETSVKGTYYCYDNKVNSMVSQQAYVKAIRENYEYCKDDKTKSNNSGNCYNTECSGKTGQEYSACTRSCYEKYFSECSDLYKKYLSERSKLDTMRWDNCP